MRGTEIYARNRIMGQRCKNERDAGVQGRTMACRAEPCGGSASESYSRGAWQAAGASLKTEADPAALSCAALGGAGIVCGQ